VIGPAGGVEEFLIHFKTIARFFGSALRQGYVITFRHFYVSLLFTLNCSWFVLSLFSSKVKKQKKSLCHFCPSEWSLNSLFSMEADNEWQPKITLTCFSKVLFLVRLVQAVFSLC